MSDWLPETLRVRASQKLHSSGTEQLSALPLVGLQLDRASSEYLLHVDTALCNDRVQLTAQWHKHHLHLYTHPLPNYTSYGTLCSCCCAYAAQFAAVCMSSMSCHKVPQLV